MELFNLLAVFSIGSKFFELKSFMSYISLGIGILLFLASTVQNHNPDDSVPEQKKSSRDNKYRDGDTNVNPQNQQNDIRAFAVREDLKLDQ